MKKITQNLTNLKAWQSIVFAFMFLFSLTINAQEVGDEFLANPGVNTTAVDAETGYDAAGTFNNNGNGNYGGWTAGTGGAYASATTANGDCHSPDRMFRLFKTGGTDGQFINQVVTALPAGNYNFGFWNKWDATSSNDEALPTWSADGDNEPKFTIKVQDAEGAWVTVHTHVPAEPTADMTWTEETGTWTNEETRDVRVMFYKNGGTGAAPSNLNNLWYIDTATLNYASALEATSGCELTVNMVDTFGDGWNGNVLDIYVNDVLVSAGNTIESGSTGTVTVSTSYGDSVLFDMVASGTYIGETEFTVTDASGEVVASAADGADATFECIDPDAVNLGVSVTTGVASATFSFDIDNFVVGDTDGVDGHIHYSLNGGNTVMVYSSDDLTLSDLPDGDHTIVFSLVNSDHTPLDPAVEATVEFSTFDGSYDCGDTQSYTYMSGSGGGFGFDNNFTEANESELIFTVTPAAGENVTLVIGGETENNYDWIYVTDEAGTLVYGPVSGPQDVTVTTTGAANVYVSADTSVTKTLTFAITCAGPPAPLMLQGILDLDQSGSTGKGIHVVANADIENLSLYGIGVANNGGGTDNQEYTFPAVSVSAGDNIMLARDMDVYAAYFEMDVATFTQANNDISQNGDDAIELFFNGEVIETFGDIDTDGTGEAWEYMDSWAYKVDGAWTYGGVNCTDGAETNAAATCVYPFTGVYTTGTEVQVSTFTLTFNVNTSNIEVGPNGMFVGGGFVDELLGGGANALPMTDEDGDGVWTASMVVPEGTTGNYTYINSTDNYDGKEDISGQECADADNWNDRVLDAPITEDTTLNHCYGSCTTDGTCPSNYFNVTFSVNTANITVGENGMYVGGGVLGDAQAYALTDDGTGTWSTVVSLLEGTAGNYIFLNSPTNGGDWNAKEDLAGQECGDAANFNDRILAEVVADVTLLHCFGSCETDGTCSAPAEPVLMPVDHENENVVYAWNDFGGTATTVVANPDASGINTSATVAQSIKTTGSETWAGTFIVLGEQLDFSEITTLAVDVWTPDGGELVNLKVENSADSYAIEINQPTTVAAGWETLYYDLSDQDLSLVYDKLVIFFDFNNAGDDTAYYFDNFRLEAAAVAGIDPGCNDFESGTEGWTVIDATGNTSNWLLDNPESTADGTVSSMGHGYFPSTVAYNDWLISPAYNTSGLSSPVVSYREYVNWWNYAGEHNVLYSTDYDGDALSATWNLLFDVVEEAGEDTWVDRAHVIPNAENIVIAFQYVGTNGSEWNIDDVCVQEDTLSTVDSTVLDMRIYPNPSDGSYVTIQTPLNGVKYVEVFDITGKRLMNTSLSADTLDVSSMSAGLYLVKVTVEGQSKTSKLIIR